MDDPEWTAFLEVGGLDSTTWPFTATPNPTALSLRDLQIPIDGDQTNSRDATEYLQYSSHLPENELFDDFDIFDSEYPTLRTPSIPSAAPSAIQTSLVSEVAPTDTASARRARKQKLRGPSAPSWMKNKSQIRVLYMDEDNTLRETMRLMKERHGFDASLQMYKDKFQEWGFVKNIPRKVAGKLARIVDERKPKNTEFVLGPKRWTAEEIRRKCERAGKENDEQQLESPVLPSELVIRTPTISPVIQNALVRQPSSFGADGRQFHFRVDPGHHGRTIWTPDRPRSTHGRPWTPFSHGSITVPQRSYDSAPNSEVMTPSHGMLPPILPPPSSSAFPWQTPLQPGREVLISMFSNSKKNIREIQAMRSDALFLANGGNITEALPKLRTTLSALQDMLAPTHDLTLDVAYELVQLLGGHDGMDEANSILDWLGSCLVSKYGLRNNKTIVHYLKVVELLRSWSRDEDAELLVYKVAEVWRDKNDTVPKIPGVLPGPSMVVTFPEADIKKLFHKPDSDEAVEVQLRLIEILMSSQKIYQSPADLQHILQGLVEYCESKEALAQIIHARQCLCKFYMKKAMAQPAAEALDALLPSLRQYWSGDNSPDHRQLKAFRDMAFLYFDLTLLSKCEDVLELTAEHLESGHLQSRREQKTLLNFHIAVGAEWQKRSYWDSAEPWFERALIYSIKFMGKNHEKSVMLLKALENGRFTLTSRELLNSELEELLALTTE